MVREGRKKQPPTRRPKAIRGEWGKKILKRKKSDSHVSKRRRSYREGSVTGKRRRDSQEKGKGASGVGKKKVSLSNAKTIDSIRTEYKKGSLNFLLQVGKPGRRSWQNAEKKKGKKKI